MGLFDNFSEDLYAALLEFVGTTLFFLLGLGGIQAAAAETASSTDTGTSAVLFVLYVSTCMSLSLLVTVFIFYRITGAVFNPNISLALLFIGAIGPVRFVLYTIAQLLGAIAASGLVLALSPGELACNTAPSNGINNAQGVFIEMFLTAALTITVLFLAAEKHPATPFAPIGIGLVLFAGHLFGAFFTGAAMNTARAFGPAVVTKFDGLSQHWVYWLGPYLGAMLGTAFYLLLKRANYYRFNPGQDSCDPEKSPAVGGTPPPMMHKDASYDNRA